MVKGFPGLFKGIDPIDHRHNGIRLDCGVIWRNRFRSPTMIPCRLPDFSINVRGLDVPCVITPISPTLPPCASALNERCSVPGPPTSTTQSTPLPPVSLRTSWSPVFVRAIVDDGARAQRL